MRPPIVNVGPVRGSRAQGALVGGSAALLALYAGAQVAAGGGSSLPMPVLGLVSLAGAIVLLSIAPEKLFLAWLLLAPLFQNAADESGIGRPLSFALYLAPPLVFGFQTLRDWRGRTDQSLVDLLPAAYCGYVVVSAFATSVRTDDDAIGLLKELFQVTAIGAMVYYFVVFGPGRRIDGESIVRMLFLGALLQAVFAIVEWPTGWALWGLNEWHLSDPPRAAATLTTPGALGTVLGSAIVLALAVLAWGGPRSLRRLSWAVLGLGLPALLLTFSRGPILAGIVAGLAVLLLARRARIVALGLVAACTIALIAVWPQITQAELYQQRVADRINIAGRADIQDVSLAAASERPFLGWGYGSFDEAKLAVSGDFQARVRGSLETTSHNGFLTTLVELGGIGVLLLLTPWLVITLRGVGAVRRHAPDRWLVVGCTAGVGVFVLNAMTTDLKFFSFVSMLPWLFVGLIRRTQNEVGATSTS